MSQMECETSAPIEPLIPPVEAMHAISCWMALLLVIVASLGYGVAFATHKGAAGILVALPCIFMLARMKTWRRAFLFGLLGGIGLYVPHLWFFREIFGIAAIPLWCIATLPMGFFTLLLFKVRQRFGPTSVMWLTPVIWLGIEFFRSELYYLRFAWMLPGHVVAFLPGLRLVWMGVYGLGFLCALGAALLIGRGRTYRIMGGALLGVLAILMYFPKLPASEMSGVRVHVAGVQLEYPSPREAAEALDQLAIAHPEAQILVLSEYAFFGPVPEVVRAVIRKHQRYLVAGGAEYAGDKDFRDMAYVVGPDGRDLFKQCKSVPVQFMRDGLAAEERRVWESPWGKIGIAICYDVSFARMMDDFVNAGAQGLIIPTMDMKNWGEYVRTMLHGRLAPIRAAEYGIPVFGVWSSGKSQLTDRCGQVIATAGYPGQGDMIAGPFDLAAAGHIPWDRYLALGASYFVGGLVLFFMGSGLLHKRGKKGAAGS